VPAISAYIAAKPRREFKGDALIRAARVSFEDALAAVDRALTSGDDANALRRLDTAIAYGTVLRSVAAASKTRRVEPLALSGLIELHLQALRLHSRFAGIYSPAVFELTLLRRLAAMYAPDGHDEVPDDIGGLVAWCASRAEAIEAECPRVNEAAADYSSAYPWTELQVALARLGYELDESGPGGFGPFAPGELGRMEAAAVLGADLDAGLAAIKKAYYRQAAMHHPDRLAEAPEDLRLAAEERMKEINAAYELLTACA
jgi:DnaJ-domain-containing protein 1